jgi:hypothetical protein
MPQLSWNIGGLNYVEIFENVFNLFLNSMSAGNIGGIVIMIENQLTRYVQRICDK